jgi:Lipocalin-like domain
MKRSSSMPSDNPDISGVCRLRAFLLEDVQTGKRFESFGPNPRGALIMHPEGRMVAVLTPAEQKAPTTETEQAAAFQRLIAYSGCYRLEPPNRFVTTVDVAWLQPLVGTEQARTYKFDGDTLDIVTAPARVPLTGDALVIGVLSWEREGRG